MATRLERAIDWGTELPGRKVGYSLIGQGEKTPSPFGKIASHGFSDYETAQFEIAFAIFSSFTRLRFREIGDASVADIYLATFKADRSSLGAMGPPGYADSGGYGAFNYRGLGWDRDDPGTGGLEQGGFGFVTIIHELGHGLGLAHPHDKGGRSGIFPGVSGSSDLGRFDLNQGVYTMMSYNDGWETNPAGEPPDYEYGYEGTPMAIDIAVLQGKYGVNTSYRTGGDTYVLPEVNASGTFYSCIWDAGGRDAIVNQGDTAATIDLRAATLKPKAGGGGYVSYVDGIFGGFTIANGVTIEDARSGAGSDVIIGNSARNELEGGAGDDTLHGRGAADRLIGGADTDHLFGGGGADTLAAGSGNDQVVGGRGADRLIAGAGSPTLTGGPGRDVFEFDASPTAGTIATIVDFVLGADFIQLVRDAFTGIGGLGTLAESAFSLGAPEDPDDRILYDGASGTVSFDEDGSGPAPAVQFARVSAGLPLGHADFVVVA